MPTVKSSDLIGLPLDWAVAKATGLLESSQVKLYQIDELWCYRPAIGYNPTPQVYYIPDYSPSTKWEDAGYAIQTMTSFSTSKADSDSEYVASVSDDSEYGIWSSFGETSLIALMRCFVASKLGEEVEVPEELIGFSVDG